MGLEEIKAKLATYKTSIRRNRVFVMLMAIIGGLLLSMYAFTSPVFYNAYASFHPETSSNNTPSLTGSPLSFLLGSGGLDGDEAGMMEEVLVSRKLSEEVVRDTVSYYGEKHLLADLVLEKFPKSFSPINILKGLIFNIPPLSYEAKIVRAGIYTKSGLQVEKVESGFLNMNFSFVDDSLTNIISHIYIEKLSQYYKNQKTEKARINLDFFTQRADSIKQELDKAARTIARFEDENKGLVFSRRKLSAREQEIKLEYLKEMYITLITNREQAASQLQRATPIIQILDYPLPPYKIIQKSVLVYLILGLVLGTLLGILWSTRALLWKDLMDYIQESLDNSGSSST